MINVIRKMLTVDYHQPLKNPYYYPTDNKLVKSINSIHLLFTIN